MLPITVLVTTRNEELNIGRCLENLSGFADEVFVIDSESEDETVAIARLFTDKVVTLPYEHSRIIPWIYQWGLDQLPITNEWIMILEADQCLSPALKEELTAIFGGTQIDADGFFIRRQQIFRGKPLRFGGYGKKYMLKLFRRTAGQLDPVEQDTRVYVKGSVKKLRGSIIEENRKEDDILFYLQKHLRYADAFAREEFIRRVEHVPWKHQARLLGSPDERILWWKTLYYRSPLYVRPLAYFLYRYFLLLGFLDGKTGFVFHFLQAFWFRLIVDIRLSELMRDSAPQQSRPVREDRA